MSSSLTVKTIPILRMDCPTCIPVLEREVLKVEGVEEVRGNYLARTLKVTFDSSKAQLAEIEAAILQDRLQEVSEPSVEAQRPLQAGPGG
jgi:copper chaperone CopZ